MSDNEGQLLHVFVALAAALLVANVVNVFPHGAVERPLQVPANPVASWPEERFVTLSHGRVRYALRGPENTGQPLVVLVHGFSTNMCVWNSLSKDLAAAGRRVLTFDNYGRGFSVAPAAPQNGPLFVGQIAELLLALNITGPIDLMGFSMGGAIVTLFSHTYPDRVRRLVLCAAAGLPVNSPPVALLLRLRFVGDLIGRFLAPIVMPKGAAKEWFDTVKSAAKIEYYLQSFLEDATHHPGYFRSLVGTIREFPMSKLEPVVAAIGKHPRSVLLVWGDRDTLVPTSNHVRYQELIPSAKLHLIPDGTHMAIIEHDQETNPAVIAFLNH